MIIDVESCLAESGPIKVLWLDALDVASIARDLALGFWLAEWLELVIDFCGNVAE